MLHSGRWKQSVAVLLGAVAVVVGLGADDAKTKSHKAGELSFEAPSAWKSEAPKSSMRKAQLKLAPVEGDKEPAELVVFVFPKGAGSVEDNIARWAGQFKDDDGNTPEADVKKVKGKNIDVTRVEISGRYVAAVTPGAN